MLEWCGLEWDEGPGREGECGPYIQSQRLELYSEQIKRLIEVRKILSDLFRGDKHIIVFVHQID